MKRPNIVLIMTDQHRSDALGCYGNPIIETPNLDWLAQEGTVFTSAYSCTPSCVPARTTLISGMDPWHTGVLGTGRGQGRMGGGFPHTLPGELAKAGYYTLGVGKMNFDPQRALNGFHQTSLDEQGKVESPGFVSDYIAWFEKNKTGDYGMTDHGIDWNSWMSRPFHAPEFLHPVNWTINESIRLLEKRDPSMPFFLKTSFSRPHSPYDPAPFYFDLYRQKTLPAPFIGEWASMHDQPKDAQKPDAWRGKRKDEEANRARAGYYGLIHQIDQQIGRLFMYLKKIGVWEHTVIIFTSDHGDMLGDHYLWRKTYAYEGSAHIPLIVRLPKAMRSSEVTDKVASPVCLQDIMPTILDAAGVPVPETVDGRSTLPLIRGERTPWREFVHGEHSLCYSEEQEMQYLTDGQWKYIWFPRLGTEQLFNLGADPGECRDLSGEAAYAGELVAWRERLVHVLDPREAGLTEGGRLVLQKDRPPLVSPHYKERIDRWKATL
ncbi:arylsulfatase [Paenibacillus allorhizosphaerae]|uniref:Arylsulfatase n=1 Tax=Paenibacillus allorhizosphaerae TaxID=2849866 RepID=A0ABM8VIH4_9BACL|nr:arylsulfatase [Paenibacillus allorhizosphaerae]CAG7644196.1 Arylsulfatase [Paenibacillus allorhizosphaerae]